MQEFLSLLLCTFLLERKIISQYPLRKWLINQDISTQKGNFLKFKKVILLNFKRKFKISKCMRRKVKNYNLVFSIKKNVIYSIH